MLTRVLCRYMACSVDACGLTPLHYAAASDCGPVCQMLISSGASISATSAIACYDTVMPCNAGMTPLHIAAMTNAFSAANAMLLAWVSQARVEPYRACHWPWWMSVKI